MYDDGYSEVKGWLRNDFGVVSPEDAGSIAHEMNSFCEGSNNLLEVGFGNGGVATWAKNSNINWIGVEVNEGLIDKAKKSGFYAIHTHQFSGLDMKFDRVVAIDVIEHIDATQVISWLRMIRSKMNMQGLLFLRFPNGDSPFGRIAQHGDPTHVNCIGRGKVFFYAADAGFDVVSIRSPAIPLLGFGLKRFLLRGLVVSARFMIGKFFQFALFGGVNVPVDSNYVVILRAK